MSTPIRFAMFADAVEARPAFDELASGLRDSAALALEPIFVSSYAGLAQTLEAGACDAAWSPPMVAQGLLASATGRPIAAVGRGGRTTYYAVLLARCGAGPVGVHTFSGAHVGWVSKLSAAGYVIPSLYLRSLGLEPDELFSKQSFLGSHDRVLRALDDGEIDVGATYATVARGGRALSLPEGTPANAKLVTAAGPIPGDVIFAAAHMSLAVREALRGAFLALQIRDDGPLSRLMNVDRFEVPALDHFETLRRWQVRAVESEPRILAAR